MNPTFRVTDAKTSLIIVPSCLASPNDVCFGFITIKLQKVTSKSHHQTSNLTSLNIPKKRTDHGSLMYLLIAVRRTRGKFFHFIPYQNSTKPNKSQISKEIECKQFIKLLTKCNSKKTKFGYFECSSACGTVLLDVERLHLKNPTNINIISSSDCSLSIIQQ